MKAKIRFIIALMAFSTCLGLMSTTYSRYVANATSNIEALFSKWQILVNEEDITANNSSSLTFTPVIMPNENVKANVVAPASKGYFDLVIDPTNVDVSFLYLISLTIDNENIPDLKANYYAFLPEDYKEEDELTLNPLTEQIITNNLYFNKEEPDFQFEPFTIRIFFEWYEGTEEEMDDEADSIIGYLAATTDLTFTIEATITFEQIINTD